MKRLIEVHQDEVLPGRKQPGDPAAPARPADKQNTPMDDLPSARVARAWPRRPADEAAICTRFRSAGAISAARRAAAFSEHTTGRSFDVESLMQAFGRLRMDVENCYASSSISASRGVSPAASRALRGRAARPTSRPSSSSTLSRTSRGREQRRPVPVGPALPRDDRARREDADRLRVDPHRCEVGHLRTRSSARPVRARRSWRG